MTGDFLECDQFTGHKRRVCRCESGLPLNGPNSTNEYRAAWGLAPIGEPESPYQLTTGPHRITNKPRYNIGASPAERQTAVDRAYPCPHRGDVIRYDESNLCGSRGQQTAIHACRFLDASGQPKYGECSLQQYCRHQTVQKCSTCEDRPAPSPAQTTTRRMPGPNDTMTPVRAVIGDKRNLLYHIWPAKESGNWKTAVAQLLRRINLFNGLRAVSVVTDKGTASLADVQAEFGDVRIDHWLTFPNNPDLREGVSFLPLMDLLPNDDSVTFWGHGKSVRHHAGSICVDWAEQQYRLLLDYWPQIQIALELFPIATCFKRYMKFGPKCKHRWHGSGGAWWMRQRDVFAVADWRSQLGNWFGSTEAWPGGVFPSGQAYCVGPNGVGDLYKPEGWSEIQKPLDDLHRVRAKIVAGVLDDETFYAQSQWKGYTSWDWAPLVETHTRGAQVLKDLGCRTVLEIGSGLGYFLVGAASIGLDARGMDMNRLERDFAISRGVPADRYALSRVDEFAITEPVDAVYCVEVFEHCTDEMLAPLCLRIAANCRWFYFTSTPHKTTTEQDAAWEHRNVKTRDEWIGFLSGFGLTWDRDDISVCEWGMVFRGLT